MMVPTIIKGEFKHKYDELVIGRRVPDQMTRGVPANVSKFYSKPYLTPIKRGSERKAYKVRQAFQTSRRTGLCMD